MEGITRSLNTIWVVAKQEFTLLFNSPVMYFIGGAWLFFNGLIFMLNFTQMNAGARPPEIGSTLSTMVFMLLFFAPAVTMRLVSDELRAGTHELLFTSPVRDWEIITGKWLAVFLVFTIFILLTAVAPLILILRGDPEIGPMLAAYLGLWLAAAGMLAVGVLFSATTQYQLVAFLLTLVTLLALWLIQPVTQLITNPTVSEWMTELSLLGHTTNFIQRSIIDPVDIAYFVALTIICLFLASQALTSRRYTG